MNKNIIGIIVTVLVLGGLIWVGRPDGDKAPAQAEGDGKLVLVGENNYNFGSISMKNGVVRQTFAVKNDSGEPLLLQKMYTSCMCTNATITIGDKKIGPVGMPGHGGVPPIDLVLAPNEEATVEVAFDPAAHGPAGVGRIERAVIIENDGGRPFEFLFEATVTP